MQATDKQIRDFKLLISTLIAVHSDIGGMGASLERYGFARMFPEDSVWEFYVNYIVGKMEDAHHYGIKESLLRNMDKVYCELAGVRDLDGGDSLIGTLKREAPTTYAELLTSTLEHRKRIIAMFEAHADTE